MSASAHAQRLPKAVRWTSERNGLARETGAHSFTAIIHLFADQFLCLQPVFQVALRLSPPLLIEFVGFLRDPFPHLIRILLHGLRLGRPVLLLHRLGATIYALHGLPSFGDGVLYPHIPVGLSSCGIGGKHWGQEL